MAMQFFYQRISRLKTPALRSTAGRLARYLKHLRRVAKSGAYDAMESSINLPADGQILRTVEATRLKVGTKRLKYLIVVGIGGSNLGTKAVYDALHGSFDLVEPNRFPKLIFLDTCDPEFLSPLSIFLQREVNQPEEILVNLISKSGTTTESVCNAEILWQTLVKKFARVGERFVVTTDEGSKLWQWAEEAGIARVPIPTLVGGRYSVLSAVGLFPLACAGVNIHALRQGALAMRQACLKPGLGNPALVSASVLYRHYQQGKVIHDTFVFHPELESLGKWYRQLVGESLGKEKNASGAEVNAGIFPSVSLGSTDLHSVGQLYLGGPKNFVTTFVAARGLARMAIPRRVKFAGLVEGIAGTSADEVMAAVLAGVKIAYAKRGLPFMEAALNDLSERSLGEFLQFKMIEIMLLAKLMRVNAFDQPNVEAYKVETRRILGG